LEDCPVTVTTKKITKKRRKKCKREEPCILKLIKEDFGERKRIRKKKKKRENGVSLNLLKSCEFFMKQMNSNPMYEKSHVSELEIR